MPTTSESRQIETIPRSEQPRRLYRSKTDRVIAGVAGGLGEFLGVDPVWTRIAFVLLTIGGGAGVLIYLVMWLLLAETPDGHQPAPGRLGSLTGATVLGMGLMMVGSIALANAFAPSLGQYFWPLALVVGGLALVLGGLNRDNDQ